MKFSNIIGNDAMKQLLNNAINTNNLVHSYMFVGPDGIGKSLFAREFAKMLLCLGNSKAEDACSSCIKFNGNNHPDFRFFDSEDGKSIKIAQIRELEEQISEKPILSERKVYVINNGDLMTVEAQNALLKTLEEPPEYAIIILVLSNESKLLNTIKSRCTTMVFQKLSNEELLQYANTQHMNINTDLLDTCDGSISKLIHLQEASESYLSLNQLIQDFSTKDIVDLWNEADILYQSKDSISSLLDYFNIVFVKKLRDTKEEKYITAIKIVEITKKRLSSNANYDMCIDYLLRKIWEEFHESHYRG